MPLPAIDPVASRILTEFKHTSPLIACRFDPLGRYLFVSAQDNSIQRYDLRTGRRTAFAGHESWVRGIAFVAPATNELESFVKAENARQALGASIGSGLSLAPAPAMPPFALITGDYHGKLLWWAGASASPKPLRSIDAHGGWVRAVAVSPDGRTVASCGNDNLVELWSVADSKHLKTLSGHESHVYNVAFHPEGKRLVSGDLKGIVKDWDVENGTVVRELDAKVLNKYDPTFMADIGGIRSIAFRKDGTELACAGITNVSNAFAGVGNPLVLLFDWKEGKPKQLKPKDAFQGTAWGVAFHPAGYVIAAGGGAQGRVWFWKDGDTASMHTLNGPVNSRDLALHPDGATFAIACADGSAKIYTMRPGAPAPAPMQKKK